jgi:GNAT superfamily N-acetyltransferase
MREILQDLSTDKLVAAYEENLFSWIPVFGSLGRAYSDDPPGVRRSITDIPMALLNSVMDARLEPEQVQPAIERVLAEARSRKVSVMWWTGPSTRPAGLGERLLEYGFVVDEDGPGMALELSRLNEDLPAPQGLTIQRVQGQAGWMEWGRAMALGFEAPLDKVEFAAGVWCDLMSHTDPEATLSYTAWQNGQPVATSLLLLAGGVAGIYAVATIPDARRQGIGAQVTLYPLLEARRMGYRAAVLGSSQMGLGVYKSLGFREICRSGSYIWRPG